MARAREILRRARTNCASPRVWLKSALLEWEEGQSAEELRLLRDGIQKFSDADKLHMMLGQLHEEQNHVEEARTAYRLDRCSDLTHSTGLLKCPFSVPLWLLYVRLEKKHNSVTKARSLLEIARKKCPQSEELWLETVKLEREAGNLPLTNQRLSAARQAIPSSGGEGRGVSEIGRIWSETVLTIPKIQRKSYISSALKEHEDDPYVVMTAAKLFWSLGKVNNAREWMKRAVAKNGDIGDFWALFYIFELQNGSDDQKKEVITNCTRANPHHGEVWPRVRKQKENRRKSVEEILKLVAIELKDVMVDFSK